MITKLPPIEFFRREHGLPSAQVQDIAVDENDRIWLATPSGLVVYDGSRCTVLNARDGLKTHGLRAVAINKDQRVLVGSDLGLDYVNNSLSVERNAVDQTMRGLVECLCCFDEDIFVGTSHGLQRVIEGRLTPVENSRLSSGLILDLCTDQTEEALWSICRAGAGLMLYQNESWRAPKHFNYRDLGRSTCITSSVNEYMIVGGEFGFAEINREGIVVTQPKEFKTGSAVSALLYAKKRLWVAQGKKLSVFQREHDRWTESVSVNVKSSINALCCDSFGTLWIATESGGLGRLSALFDVVEQVLLPQEHSVFSVSAVENHQLLIAGDEFSWRGSDSDPGPVQSIAALDNVRTWDLVHHSDGLKYAATSVGLVQITADGERNKVGRTNEVLSAPGRCLLSKGDDLLVGTLSGCAKLTAQKSVQPLGTANGQSIGYVYTMVEDHNGDVWIGTLGGGLWKLAGDHCVPFSGGGLLPRSNIYAIAVRADDVLAIVQDDAIFLMPSGCEPTKLTSSEEAIAAWALCWDDDGALWAGTSDGLVQFNSEDGRELRRIQALLGASNWEFTCSRSLFKHNNSFYCGLNSGLVRVDRDALLAIKNLPEVHINRIHFNNVIAHSDKGVKVVEVGYWTMSVEIYSTWSLDQSSVRFQHRLLGFDEKWSELSRSSLVHYSSLPANEYLLEVRAHSPLVGNGPVCDALNLRVVATMDTQAKSMFSWAWVNKIKAVGRAVRRYDRLVARNEELEKRLVISEADLVQTRKQVEYLVAKSVKHNSDEN